VFVESESKRIGTLQVPDRLLEAMRGARCVLVDTPRALRIALLKQEYGHFLADPGVLGARLDHLAPLHGRKTVARWRDAAQGGDFDTLVGELLDLHYDPLYRRSIERNFPRHVDAQVAEVSAVDTAAFEALAARVVAHASVPEPETLAP
jgi:tRNA 2-selenouridine synthase